MFLNRNIHLVTYFIKRYKGPTLQILFECLESAGNWANKMVGGRWVGSLKVLATKTEDPSLVPGMSSVRKN